MPTLDEVFQGTKPLTLDEVFDGGGASPGPSPAALTLDTAFDFPDASPATLARVRNNPQFAPPDMEAIRKLGVGNLPTMGEQAADAARAVPRTLIGTSADMARGLVVGGKFIEQYIPDWMNWGFQIGPDGVKLRHGASPDVEQNDLYTAATRLKEGAEDAYPADPRLKDSPGTMLATGMASTLPMMLPAAGAARIAGTAAGRAAVKRMAGATLSKESQQAIATAAAETGAQGAANNAVAITGALMAAPLGYDEAMAKADKLEADAASADKNGQQEQAATLRAEAGRARSNAFNAAGAYAAGGVTNVLPIGQWASRLSKINSDASRRLAVVAKDIVFEGIEEAAQELGEGGLQNYVAKKMFDKDRDLYGNLTEQGIMGGVVGSLMAAITHAPGIIKARMQARRDVAKQPDETAGIVDQIMPAPAAGTVDTSALNPVRETPPLAAGDRVPIFDPAGKIVGIQIVEAKTEDRGQTPPLKPGEAVPDASGRFPSGATIDEQGTITTPAAPTPAPLSEQDLLERAVEEALGGSEGLRVKSEELPGKTGDLGTINARLFQIDQRIRRELGPRNDAVAEKEWLALLDEESELRRQAHKIKTGAEDYTARRTGKLWAVKGPDGKEVFYAVLHYPTKESAIKQRRQDDTGAAAPTPISQLPTATPPAKAAFMSRGKLVGGEVMEVADKRTVIRVTSAERGSGYKVGEISSVQNTEVLPWGETPTPAPKPAAPSPISQLPSPAKPGLAGGLDIGAVLKGKGKSSQPSAPISQLPASPPPAPPPTAAAAKSSDIALLTPEEYARTLSPGLQKLLADTSSNNQPNREALLQDHYEAVQKALRNKQPVAVAAVEAYGQRGLDKPFGYVIDGNRYVFKPAAATEAAANPKSKIQNPKSLPSPISQLPTATPPAKPGLAGGLDIGAVLKPAATTEDGGPKTGDSVLSAGVEQPAKAPAVQSATLSAPAAVVTPSAPAPSESEAWLKINAAERMPNGTDRTAARTWLVQNMGDQNARDAWEQTGDWEAVREMLPQDVLAELTAARQKAGAGAGSEELRVKSEELTGTAAPPPPTAALSLPGLKEEAKRLGVFDESLDKAGLIRAIQTARKAQVQAAADKALGKGAIKAVTKDDVPPGVRKQLSDQGTDNPRAFYVEGDGLYVVVENLPTDRPIEQALRESFQHETMHGLRDMLGPEKYNALLRAVKKGLTPEAMRFVVEHYKLAPGAAEAVGAVPGRTAENGLNELGVIDEALGKMAEDVKGVRENSRLKRIWQRVCHEVRLALMKVFNKFGVSWKWLKLSENDMRVMLRKSIEGRARSETAGAEGGEATARAQALSASEELKLDKIKVGMKLREISEFPQDSDNPKLLNIRGTNLEITARAGEEFASWKSEITAADGSQVLLHNPEQGRISNRVRHLIFDNDTDQLDPSKALWLPSVPSTLKQAVVRLIDPESKNRIYVRQYADGTKHMVVVQPNGEVVQQQAFTGKLITQFPEAASGKKRSEMEIDWVMENGIGQPHGVPAPTPTGSTIRGSGQSAFQGISTPEGGGTQEQSFDSGLPMFAKGEPEEGGVEFRAVRRGRDWVVEDRNGNVVENHGADKKQAQTVAWGMNVRTQKGSEQGTVGSGQQAEPEMTLAAPDAHETRSVAAEGTGTGEGGDFAAAVAARHMSAAETLRAEAGAVGKLRSEWTEIFNFWRKSLTDKLKMAGGRIASELEPAVQRFFDTREDLAGHYGSPVDRPVRKMTRKERRQAFKEFADWQMLNQIQPGDLTPPVVRELAKRGLAGLTAREVYLTASRPGQLLMDNAPRVLDEIGTETERREILLQDARTGEWVRFKKRDNYWMHGLDDRIAEVLRDPFKVFKTSRKKTAEWRARYDALVAELEEHIAHRWSTRAHATLDELLQREGAEATLDGPESAARDKLVSFLAGKFNEGGLTTSERLADAFFSSVDGRRLMKRLEAVRAEKPSDDRTAEEIETLKSTTLDTIAKGLTRRLQALDRAELRDDIREELSGKEVRAELAAGSPDRTEAALVAALKNLGHKLGKVSRAKLNELLASPENLAALTYPDAAPETYKQVIANLAAIVDAAEGKSVLGDRLRKALDKEGFQAAVASGDIRHASILAAATAQQPALQRSQKMIEQALDGVDADGEPIIRQGEQVPTGVEGLRNSLVPMKPDKAKRLAVDAIRQWTQKPLIMERTDDQNSNIERGRVGGIPPHWINYRYEEALPRYVNAWARRAAEIEAFGQGATKETPDLFDEIGAKADPDTQKYLSELKKDIYGLNLEGPIKSKLKWLQAYTAASKLGTGNVFGALRNLVTVFYMAPTTLGYRNMARELMEIPKLLAQFETARDLGILRNDMVAGYIEARQLGEQGEKVVRWAMATSGYSLAEETSRVIAMGTAIHAKRQWLAMIADDPNSLQSIRVKRIIEAHGVSVEKLAAEGEEMGPETRKWLRAAVREVMFNYDLRAVGLVFNTPAARLMLQFQKFLLQMSRFMDKRVFEPAWKGYEIKPGERPTSRLAPGMFVVGNRLHDFRPMLIFLAASGTASALMALRAAGFGKDRPDPPWEEIGRTWDEKKGRATWLAMVRIYRDLMFSGILGWLGNTIELGANVTDRMRGRNPLEPPAFSTLRNILDTLLLRTWQQGGRMTPDQWGDFLKREFPGYNYAEAAGKTALVAAGAPLKAAEVEAARRAVGLINGTIRRFKAEMEYEQPNRMIGERTYTERTPDLDFLYELTVTGDGAGAKAQVDRMIAGKSYDETRRTLASIKGYLTRRHPGTTGGLEPEDNKAFKEDYRPWLAKRRPELVRVLDTVEDNYDRAMHEAGLAKDPRDTALKERVATGREGRRLADIQSAAQIAVASRAGGITPDQAQAGADKLKVDRLRGGGLSEKAQAALEAVRAGKFDGRGWAWWKQNNEKEAAAFEATLARDKTPAAEVMRMKKEQGRAALLDYKERHGQKKITVEEILKAAGAGRK